MRSAEHTDLTWPGTLGANAKVDIVHGGSITTVNDTGSYTDPIGAGGGGSYPYQVCETGTATCSAWVTLIF